MDEKFEELALKLINGMGRVKVEPRALRNDELTDLADKILASKPIQGRIIRPPSQAHDFICMVVQLIDEELRRQEPHKRPEERTSGKLKERLQYGRKKAAAAVNCAVDELEEAANLWSEVLHGPELDGLESTLEFVAKHLRVLARQMMASEGKVGKERGAGAPSKRWRARFFERIGTAYYVLTDERPRRLSSDCRKESDFIAYVWKLIFVRHVGSAHKFPIAGTVRTAWNKYVKIADVERGKKVWCSSFDSQVASIEDLSGE